MSVPGLKGVIDRDVFVLPTGVPDKDVNDSIRRMMQTLEDDDVVDRIVNKLNVRQSGVT